MIGDGLVVNFLFVGVYVFVVGLICGFGCMGISSDCFACDFVFGFEFVFEVCFFCVDCYRGLNRALCLLYGFMCWIVWVL